jgi:hypothetical protein
VGIAPLALGMGIAPCGVLNPIGVAKGTWPLYMLPNKPVTGRAVGLLPPRMSCMNNSMIGSFPVAAIGSTAVIDIVKCEKTTNIAKGTIVSNPIAILFQSFLDIDRYLFFFVVMNLCLDECNVMQVLVLYRRE